MFNVLTKLFSVGLILILKFHLGTDPNFWIIIFREVSYTNLGGFNSLF